MTIIKKYILKIYRHFKPIKQKTYEGWKAKGYIVNPEISFIIQSHNKSKQVIKIIDKLRSCKNSEIIVIDDGSEINHTLALRKKLTQANEFLLVANDLYELTTYDRSIYFTRGNYVALLQDDDDFGDMQWVTQAVEHFKQHPEMVILGGKDGATYLDYEKTNDGQIGKCIFENNIVSRKNLFKMKLFNEKNLKNNFQFVQFVNRAPMWIKRDLFLNKLYNMDMSYLPFLHDDAEICLRAWLTGLKVGWYKTSVMSGHLGLGGTKIWNRDIMDRQTIVNSKKIQETYGKKFNYIQSLVDKANASI